MRDGGEFCGSTWLLLLCVFVRRIGAEIFFLRPRQKRIARVRRMPRARPGKSPARKDLAEKGLEEEEIGEEVCGEEVVVVLEVGVVDDDDAGLVMLVDDVDVFDVEGADVEDNDDEDDTPALWTILHCPSKHL